MTTRTIDTTHLIPALRDLVHGALSLGWTAQQGGNGRTVMLRSYNGQKQLAVDPVRSMNDRMLKQKQRTVARYADPVKMALLDAASSEAAPLLQGLSGIQAEAQAFTLIGQGQVPPKDVVEAAVESMHANRNGVEDSGRREVSRRPWQARRVSNPAGGTVYDSDAVVEVRYSDGQVAYECALGCGFTHPTNPRSVAAHYGKAHTLKGEVPPAEGGRERIDPAYVEPLTHREYTPTERLIRLLQHAIEEAMTGSWNSRDLAVAVLRWQHDRVGEGGEPGPSVPLTDSQIVERIRLMLDTGESVEQQRRIDAMEQTLASLDGERRLTDHALMVMEQRAVKAETALSALAELATDAARAS